MADMEEPLSPLVPFLLILAAIIAASIMQWRDGRRR